jgi:hypothetical protein
MMLSDDKQATIAAELAAEGLPPDLVKWLAKLKLLYGVPFNYLVPDNSLLPAETIRFFNIDPDWMSALIDGALSIGRHYGGAETPPVSIRSDLVHHRMLHTHPDRVLGNIRRRQIGLREAPAASAAQVEADGGMSGFLLNSAAVKGWKSIDVAGYQKGSSPYDYEQNRIPASSVQSLDIRRLVRLSPSVMLGIFNGPLYELVLHQPPEAIHFGFLTVANDGGNNFVTKTLRVPTTSWDDPDTKYDADTYQNQKLSGVFVDPADRVLDMTALSKALAAQLATTGANGAPAYYRATPPDANYKDHLVASDFGLEMVQGVGLVSFINE